ncbi:MAG TPA: hypothetical protein VGP93_02200, partial [Polyangiaceae bacterium]|nr:hypothetical protein [Polyangiaceae bacterium]
TDADPAEALKITVVERVRGLQTKEAAEVLKTLLAQFPKNGSEKVRKALQEATQSKAKVAP